MRSLNNDDWQELYDMMRAECDTWEADGNDWSTYVPSKALRQEARARGYSIRKVRAQGAFPYAIVRPDS